MANVKKIADETESWYRSQKFWFQLFIVFSLGAFLGRFGFPWII